MAEMNKYHELEETKSSPPLHIQYNEKSTDRTYTPTPSLPPSTSLFISSANNNIADTSSDESEAAPQILMNDGESKKRANNLQTVIAIVRCFMGTAILLLPRAAYNGGILPFVAAMAASYLLNVVCMRMLIECCEITDATSYSAVGYAAYGKCGQIAIDISIVLSQMAFCSILFIFISSNIRDLNLLFHDCNKNDDINLWYIFAAQLVVFAPLVWVRRIKYLSPLFSFANVLIISGLFVIYAFCLLQLYYHGVQDVRILYNTNWPVMLGTVIYSWEGIGLVAPVRASMRAELQHNYPNILGYTLAMIVLFSGTLSCFGYAAYGSHMSSIILFNLPNNWMSIAVEVAYTVGVALSFPFMLFPVTHVIEQRLLKYVSFSSSTQRKWAKNCLRTAAAAVALIVGLLCRAQLDNFSALVGSAFCVPLAYIYPAIFYRKLAPMNRTKEAVCIFLIAVGTLVMIGTTYSSITTWHVNTVQFRCFDL